MKHISMKGKANIGSKVTLPQRQRMAKSATGYNKSIRVSGRRPSGEGYQHAMRADIIPRESGYAAARRPKGANRVRIPPSSMSGIDFSHSYASSLNNVSYGGINLSGSASILKSRMGLDQL